MRHLGSLILSLVLAPIIWVLTGIGLVEYGPARDRLGSDVVLALAALVAAGTLFAVLAIARISPVGPMLAGLAYLGIVAWATLDHASLQATLPRSVLGTESALTRPADGYAVLLAIPLLATAFGAGRWRRERQQLGRHAVVAGQPAAFEGTRSAGADTSDSLVEPVPTGSGPSASPDYPWRTPRAATPAQGGSEDPTMPGGAAGGTPESDETTSLLIAPPPRRSRATQDAETVAGGVRQQAPGRQQESSTAAGSDTPRDPGTDAAAATTQVVPPSGGRRIPSAAPPRRRQMEQTVDPDDATRPLRGTPPPPAAYPPPGHSTPTARPVDPDATERL